MGSVIQKPTLFQRVRYLLKGFDGPLAFAVFMLACAGLLIMFSAGHDHGSRFVDHGRNMVLAGAIMFVVAQVPPQKLMAWAVPVYTLGVVLLIAVAIGASLAALLGLLIGFSTLRLREDYLAIVTIGVSEIVRLAERCPALLI